MTTTAAEPKRKVSADEAREVAEAAREQEWAAPSFVRDLFLGKLRMDLIHPYPEQDPEEIRRAQPFLEQLERLLRETVDSDRIDREGEIPDAVVQGLRALGAFGIKIPREYGGLGLSQLSYMKAIELLSSVDGSLTALVSAQQSIGVPQPLKMFGTEAQKKRYLPRLAKGAISAFALTEPGVGSDPAAMETTAVPSEDGKSWILNGEKLWCTNGTKAELMVVMARTPSKFAGGKERRQITAFVVETAWPGGEVAHRCHFMGMEAVAELCGAMADRGGYDIRLEAAIAKLYNSEVGWRIIDDTVQIRGGRGYETADSLRARGEKPIPVERIMRDFRINLIFEGSSEIMHLFIAREAVDKHLQVAGDVVLPGKSLGQRLRGVGRPGLFYGWWYPGRWLGWSAWPRYDEFWGLARHVRFVERNARRLARGVFHSMLRFGPKLEFRQAVLFRLVDVAGELFAMAATCARARMLVPRDPVAAGHAVQMADLFCRQSRGRIRAKFKGLWRNEDVPTYRVAQEVLEQKHLWLEQGMVRLQ